LEGGGRLYYFRMSLREEIFFMVTIFVRKDICSLVRSYKISVTSRVITMKAYLRK
jgi:hypothetical protein